MWPSGIDEMMIRQPLGVTAAITPFNFPAMIPFWFLPYAIACGNTFILKPSERVPLTAQTHLRVHGGASSFPPGVINLLHGGKSVVDAFAGASRCSRDQFRRFHSGRADIFMRRVPCMESACNARAARRITLWFCPMRIWRRRLESSATALSVAPDSDAWRFPWPSPWGTRRSNSPRK